MKLKVGDLRILETSSKALTIQAHVNFTNPSIYTAFVPSFGVNILKNGSVIGKTSTRNIHVDTGENFNVLVEATWDPLRFGGRTSSEIGVELLSQYISGFNTTLTLQTSEHSIPYQPKIGKALMKFPVEIPTPRISNSETEQDHDGPPQFIKDATFHLFSSTGEFTLVSPLQYSIIYIENINATAYYNHTEPIGHIDYNLPFKVPPGTSSSPRIPVEWSLDSVGYEKLREALGGTLKLDAKGIVSVRLERWSETVWYAGSGIGASVRL